MYFWLNVISIFLRKCLYFQAEDSKIQISCLRIGISDLRKKSETDQETIATLSAEVKIKDKNFEVAMQNVKLGQDNLQKVQAHKDEVNESITTFNIFY